MRTAVIALSGFLVTFLLVWDAYKRKKQFYPTVVYLTNHQPLIAIIGIQCVILAFLFSKLLTRIFFGRLQQAEMDNVVSQSWYAFFDMCLVFAFFQDELGSEFMVLFSVLLFVRSFHWLIEERIDYMERTPVINFLFHLRMQGLIFILGCIDLYFIKRNYWITISSNHSVKLALGVEYFNLLLSLAIILVRYIMHTIDSMREHPWEKKAVCLLYADIIIGFLRLLLYVEFTTIMWKLHPFPLFVARPIYLSVRSLKKSIRDLFMSRRAIRYLNTVFRNATAADLAASSDTVCIVCREEMHVPDASGAAANPADSQPTSSTLKRLPCSHIFHANCLLSWFQRQQTCPTCRMHVLRQAAVQQEPQAAAAQPNVSQATGGQQQGIEASAAAAGQPPWMPAGMQPPFYSPFWPNAFPPVPPSDQQTAGSDQQTPPPFPGMVSPMFMPPPFMGMPIIYPGNLFPPLTSPMPDPPSTGAPDSATEARLRASALARFTALRQINVLLQAATLQMNAYLTAATDPTVGGESGDTSNGNPLLTGFIDRPPDTNDNISGEEDAKQTNEVSESEEGKPEVDQPPSYAETSSSGTPDSNQTCASDEKDLVVIRRRWLEKLDSQKKVDKAEVTDSSAPKTDN